MGIKLDSAKAVNTVAKNTKNTAKEAADALGAAGSIVTGAVKDAAKTANSIAGSLAENASSAGNMIASSKVGKVAATISDSVGAVGSATINTVGSVVREAKQTVHQSASNIASKINENTPSARLKRERISGARDGINQGVYLAAENRYNFYYAYVATLCFFLRCDGLFTDEEEKWLASNLNHLKLEGGLPDKAKEKIRTIAEDKTISFEQVKEYLDQISLSSLDSISEHVQLSVELDDEITSEEKEAQKLFSDYVSSRTEAACEIVPNPIHEAIEKSVAEYEENYDQITEEFKRRTGLQGSDYAFLIGATLLQTLRVFVINAITKVDAAGSGNRNERVLHDFQDKVLQGFKGSADAPSRLMYASTEHIIAYHGVPYDVTNGGQGLFKGANHRFSTLGHDPLLGLIFGTSNIMTNCITLVKDTGIGLHLPLTCSVDYGEASPLIGLPVGTAPMLAASGKRVFDEPNAACAALIKQLLHIGTDLYTIAGIQIPFANIVLDKAHVERLTQYVSTGDLMKIGAQAGFATFINWLIAALHGCSLVFKDDGRPFDIELHQARTKKIILISDTFATSSSVLQAAITKNLKCLDFGGAVVLVKRLFSDLSFIGKLKEEFINSGLNDIYEQRAKEVLR